MTPAQMAAIHAASFSQPRPWSEAEFTDLANAPLCLFTFTDHGFAVFRQAGPEAELLTIAVHPNARKTGEGKTLLKQGITQLSTSNCEEIFLEVAIDNTAARALYAAFGFEQAAIRKDYYDRESGAKISALVMRKTL